MGIQREAVKLPQTPELLPFLEKEYIATKSNVYVDLINFDEINEVLIRQSKKFKRILFEVLRGSYNNSLYRKEEISDKAKGITAIKFSTKPNRIYCKEYFLPDGSKNVVLICVYSKKSEKVDKATKNLIEAIAEYEYSFEEKEE